MPAQQPENPYDFFLKIPVRTPDHYELLGLTRFEDDPVVIKQAAHERNQTLKSWDNSEYYLWSNELLSEVVAALLVLESPSAKQDYDRQLRAQRLLSLSRSQESAPAREPTRGAAPADRITRNSPRLTAVEPTPIADPAATKKVSIAVAAVLLLIGSLVSLWWFTRPPQGDMLDVTIPVPQRTNVLAEAATTTSANGRDKLPEAAVASIRPHGDRLFTAATIQFPYVYVLDNELRSSNLWVFTLPDTAKARVPAGPEMVVQLVPSKGARPALPRDVGALTESYWLPDVGTGRDLVVRGKYLLVPKSGGLQVVDINNPAEPRPLRQIAVASSQETYSIVENGSSLFLLNKGSVGLFDVADPAFPRLVSSSDSLRSMWCGCVVGNRLYGGVFDEKFNSHGIVVYDITDPGRPLETGFHKLAVPPCHIASISPSRLVVLEKSIRYFDLSDSDSLQEFSAVPDTTGDRTLTLFTGENPGFLTDSAFHPLAGKGSPFRVAECTQEAPYHGCRQGDYALVTADKEVLVFRGASADTSGRVIRDHLDVVVSPPVVPSIAGAESSPIPKPAILPVASPFPDLSQVKSAELLAVAKSIQEGMNGSPNDKSVEATRQQLILAFRSPVDPSERLIAADLMRRLAWPDDSLERSRIPAHALAIAGFGRAEKAPAELVAVLGDGRLAEWDVVTALAVSPDGSRIASVCGGRVVSIWGGSNGELLRTLTATNPIADGCLAFSPHDHLVAAAVGTELFIWDIETGEQTVDATRAATSLMAASTGTITTISFSPDGQTVATAGRHKSVNFVDVTSGEVVRSLPGHRQETSQLHFSPNGEFLGTAGADGQYWLRKVSDGQQVTLKDENSVQGLFCTFSSNAWITASTNLDGGFAVYDLTMQRQRLLPMKFGWVKSMVVVEVAAKPTIPKKPAGTDKKTSPTAKPSEEAIVYGDANKVVAHSLATGKSLLEIDGYLGQPQVAANSNRQYLATAGQTISVWDPATWRESPLWGAMPHAREGTLQNMAVHPDGKQLAVLRTINPKRGPACSVALYDLETGSLLRELPGPARFQGRAIAFSPDGKQLSIAGGGPDGGTLATFDQARRRFEVGKTLSTRELNSILFTSDGTAVTGDDSSMVIIDATTGATRLIAAGTGGNPLLSASIDGTSLACCQDRTLQVWDIKTGVKRHSKSLAASPQCVALNPDGAVVVVASNGSLEFYDSNTGIRQESVEIAAAETVVPSVAWSPDGRHVAASDNQGSVHLLSTRPPQRVRQWQVGPRSSHIRQVWFTADSRHLLTLNPNGTVYVLRLESVPAR